MVSTVLHGCHTRLEGETTFRRWWFVDAEGQVPGKLAAKIVKVIMGKHKPIYDRSQVSRLLFIASSGFKVSVLSSSMAALKYHTSPPSPVNGLLSIAP